MVAKDLELTKFDEETVKKMQKGYWLTGFGTGPDTVMLALWSIGMISIASSDSTCSAYSSYSSGADGSLCTTDAAWNETLWQDSGGVACVQGMAFGGEKYVHNPAKAGCGAALVAYRAATQYTCNCTGDHSYTSLGWRPYNVVIFSLTIISIILAVGGIILGAILDYSSKRLSVWKTLYVLGCVSTLGMAATFSGIWPIALIFHVLTHTFTELVVIPRSSYIKFVAHDNATRQSISGMRQYMSFISQTLFLVLCLPLSIIFDATPNVGACIIALLCAVWYGIFMWPAFLKLQPVGPSRAVETGSVLSNAMSDIITEIPVMFKKYPEAVKCLLLTTFANIGGPATILSVNTPYGLTMGLSGFQLNILILIVLVLGIGFARLYACLFKTQRLKSLKRTWMLVLLCFLLIGSLVPLLVTPTAPFIQRLIFIYLLAGLFAAIGLTWYYSIGWPTFVTMVPASKVQLYSAYLMAVGIGTSWIGSTTYAAIVQATNDHQMAWASMVGYNLIAWVLLLTIDFEKGARDAGHNTDVVSDAVDA